jgi:membrane protein YqaA with SNARE-associated domain
VIEAVGAVLTALAAGIASALVPVINAEALLVAAAVAGPDSWAFAALVAVSMAVGQTLGKVILFEAARRRLARPLGGKRAERPPRSGWQRRALDLLGNRWSAVGVVLLSASVGLPPLALVSIAAGSLQMRRTDFVVCCLAGRVVRFSLIACSITLAQ